MTSRAGFEAIEGWREQDWISDMSQMLGGIEVSVVCSFATWK